MRNPADPTPTPPGLHRDARNQRRRVERTEAEVRAFLRQQAAPGPTCEGRYFFHPLH